MRHLEIKNTPLCIIFQLSSRCFPWRWNTASHAWWITSRSRMSLHSVSFFIMFCSPDSYFVPWICFHSLLHLKFLYLGTTLIWSGKAYEKQFTLKVHKWTPRIDRHSQKVIVSMANRYCIILTFLKWTLSQAGTFSDCKNVQLQDSCLTVPHNILRFFFLPVMTFIQSIVCS